MNLVIASDRRFLLSKDGKACCTDGSRGYCFWSRYLDVFDSVTVVARVKRENCLTGFSVEGDRVSLVPLVDYVGPSQFLVKRATLEKQIAQACQSDSTFLLRIPGNIGSLMHKQLRQQGCPYGVEVVGDPFTLLAPGAYIHPLRPFIRWNSVRNLRNECQHASWATYVTERALQSSYPPSQETLAIGCSDVEMPSEAFALAPREVESFQKPQRIVFVGTLAQLYKAPNILIDAFSRCLTFQPSLELVIIGDGKHQEELRAKCRLIGISNRVQFLGRLAAGKQIRQQLDNASLFVLPSFQEGLPRAMVEAMGRGLPCIGSKVGGIPELLEPDCMVPPGKAEPLAAKIIEMLADPQKLANASRRNLQVARRYHSDVLVAKRLKGLMEFRKMNEARLAAQAA